MVEVSWIRPPGTGAGMAERSATASTMTSALAFSLVSTQRLTAVDIAKTSASCEALDFSCSAEWYADGFCVASALQKLGSQHCKLH